MCKYYYLLNPFRITQLIIHRFHIHKKKKEIKALDKLFMSICTCKNSHGFMIKIVKVVIPIKFGNDIEIFNIQTRRERKREDEKWTAFPEESANDSQ